MTDRPSDEALMKAVRAGERASLTVLFERHGRRLFGFLHGLVGSPAMAEDLVQETFLRILRHRATYRPGLPFLPWMLSISRNAARAQAGSEPRLAAAGSAEGSVEKDQPRRTPTAPAEGQRAVERAERLRKGLAVLAEGDREILLLSYFDGLRHREIAEVVGATPAAVKVRIHRARKQLRQSLDALEGR